MDFSKIRNFLFIGLLAFVSLVFLIIIKEFAYPIFWAAVLAGVFYPVYKLINGKIKVPNLSTAITMMLIIIIIVVPFILISTLVIRESIELYTSFTHNGAQVKSNIIQAVEWVKQNPYTAQFNINENAIAEKFAELGQAISSFLLKSAKDITQNTIIFGIMFFVTFYTLFYFIRDGEKLLHKLMHLCPLGDEQEKLLYNKFTSTARATIKGSLIVGLIQGALGGIMFALVGIKGAVIWGILMVLVASIPALGSYFIWLPAAIVMLISGRTWAGIGMILFGSLVIGTIDNIIRPILVGKDSQMHPLLVLLSTLGGIVVFGVAGFIIGPVIASLMMAFWEMYDSHYKKHLDRN